MNSREDAMLMHAPTYIILVLSLLTRSTRKRGQEMVDLGGLVLTCMTSITLKELIIRTLSRLTHHLYQYLHCHRWGNLETH